jgi:hypothetical protein
VKNYVAPQCAIFSILMLLTLGSKYSLQYSSSQTYSFCLPPFRGEIKFLHRNKQTDNLSIYGSTPLCWTVAAFQFLDLLPSRYDSLAGDSAHRKVAPCIHRTPQRINAHTDSHDSSGIRTHVPSVWECEDSSCFRPRDHCNRQIDNKDIKYYNTFCLISNITVHNESSL